jgi:hypothetical protein
MQAYQHKVHPEIRKEYGGISPKGGKVKREGAF